MHDIGSRSDYLEVCARCLVGLARVAGWPHVSVEQPDPPDPAPWLPDPEFPQPEADTGRGMVRRILSDLTPSG